MTEIRRITADDADQVLGFMSDLPEGDRTFVKEPSTPERVGQWPTDRHTLRYGMFEDRRLKAMFSITPGVGWSSHVGELRLVVGAPFRGQGLGRAMSRHGLAEALRLGLHKIMIEVVADKQGDIEMFTSIGFRPEALLQDQIRDQDGELHDLVLLSHDVEQVAGGMQALGLDRAMNE
jgi:ribosomal protein S18 acetylase RimI-like enzyme